MSIIYEALKKAQNNLSRNQKKEVAFDPTTIINEKSAPLQPAIKMERPSSKVTTPRTSITGQRPYRSKRLLVFLSLFSMLSACWFVLFKTEKISTQNLRHQESLPFLSIASMKRTESAPAQDKAYILSGTMMMGERQAALINDEIYTLGENIDGMKIARITLESVDLLDNGKTITLHVKPH